MWSNDRSRKIARAGVMGIPAEFSRSSANAISRAFARDQFKPQTLRLHINDSSGVLPPNEGGIGAYSSFKGSCVVGEHDPRSNGREVRRKRHFAVATLNAPVATDRMEPKMNRSKCPNCGVKLGNFLYADVCPHCHEELKHNTKRLVPSPQKDPKKPRSWLVRAFFRIVRFVES